MDNDFDEATDHGHPTLGSLVRGAGFPNFRAEGNARAIPYVGRSREWLIVARAGENGWLNVYAMVCELPAEPGLRSRLLEAAMKANRAMTLTKFIASDRHLIIELNYLRRHVDAAVFRELVAYLYAEAEEHYPRLFRIVSGDDVLKSLTIA